MFRKPIRIARVSSKVSNKYTNKFNIFEQQGIAHKHKQNANTHIRFPKFDIYLFIIDFLKNQNKASPSRHKPFYHIIVCIFLWVFTYLMSRINRPSLIVFVFVFVYICCLLCCYSEKNLFKEKKRKTTWLWP